MASPLTFTTGGHEQKSSETLHGNKVAAAVPLSVSLPLFSSHPHQHTANTTMATTDLKAQQRRKFEGVFEKLRNELVDHLKGENMPTEAVEWYRRVGLSWRSHHRCVLIDRWREAEPRL